MRGRSDSTLPGQSPGATSEWSEEPAQSRQSQLRPLFRWRRPKPPGLKVVAGKLVLLVCPSGKKQCTNLRCRLQPFCSCARADLNSGDKAENGVWLLLLALGCLLIVVALTGLK